MLTKLITGLLTFTGLVWLWVALAGNLVQSLVDLAAVPADWVGLVTIGMWIIVIFFGGGFSLAIGFMITGLAVALVSAVTDG
jgi:hypothetical protein